MKTQRFRLFVLLASIALITPLAAAGGIYANAQTAPCIATPIPGGGTITFSSNRDGNFQIYVMDGDECHLQKLTIDAAVNWGPTWSPDGTQLVFVSNLYLDKMNADGSNRTRLVNNAPGGQQWFPAWSPNGTQIAFQISLSQQEIFVVNVDGTNLRRLTNTPGRDNFSPSWSPDGTQILFTSRRDPGNDGEAWVMNPDGSNQHQIMADNSSGDAGFAWSPDGSKIAFESLRDGNREVYVMNVDGSNQVRLTNNSTDDWYTKWSPDSTRLVFYSYHSDGNVEIYVMNADGTNQTRVTNNPAIDTTPVWGGPRINLPPTASAGGSYLVAKGSTITLDGTGSDPNQDPLTFSWTATDGSFDDSALEDPVYTAGNEAGIFELALTVTDPGGLSDTDTTMVVVYDPDGGFVTGGGWIDSPEGAYIHNPSLTGKANFGFVSKYKKGAKVPTGQTQFEFKAGNLNFHSDGYDWLVVNQGGTNAQYKGSGTINGDLAPTGEAYKFMLWANDLDPDDDDTFRIKIWYDDADSEIDVYDNGFDQAIGGGDIVIHKAK